MTINNIIDREIDEKMDRTKKRNSVGEDALPPENMLVFGVLLSILGILLGFAYFGPFTAFHLAWGNLFYIFGYSIYLKKKSIWNTFIGGFASPSPVWVGFAARYENLSLLGGTLLGVPLEGWLLGGIVFFWSASHTFSLAGFHIEDYRNANVPMLPVVIGMKKAATITLVWGIWLILYSAFVSVYITGLIEVLIIFLIPSLFLVYGLLKFYRYATPQAAKISFIAHNLWLPIVFISIVALTWLF